LTRYVVRKRLLIFLAAAAGLALLGLLFWPAKPEPLVYRGQPVEAWAIKTLAGDHASRQQATEALQALGPKAVPPLLSMLEARDPFWRELLWDNTKRLPRSWLRPVLLRVGPRQGPTYRTAGVRALGIIGPPAQAAVPTLSDLLHGKEPQLAWESSTALGRIGPAAVPALVSALNTSNTIVRQMAVHALGQVGPGAEPAVPELIQMLSDLNSNLRDAAAASLHGIGPGAVPLLVRALEHENSRVRIGAAKALTRGTIPQRAAEAALLKMVQGTDAAERESALNALASLLWADPPVITAFTAALNDPEPTVRLAAAKGLGDLSWKAGPAVPMLTVRLYDPSLTVREWAARTLGRIGVQAQPALPELKQLLQSEEAAMSRAAEEAIHAIETSLASYRSKPEPIPGAPSQR
jgi:HEAT repeat protein